MTEPAAATLKQVLEESRVIAVVGLSRDPRKDSHGVAAYLQATGYVIVPVNPHAGTILGETAYPSLAELPAELAARTDLVDVFRPPADVPGIVAEALEHLPNLRAIWLQLGIVHQAAAARSRAAGLTVVQDRCIRTEHQLLTHG